MTGPESSPSRAALTEANKTLKASLQECSRQRRDLERKNTELRYFLNKLPAEVVREWFTEDEQRRFGWAGLPSQD